VKTHLISITCLDENEKPIGEMGFELTDVPRGPGKLPEILRSIADEVEADQSQTLAASP